jgi:DNA (cytosine-5)-methyltransferase 1
MQIIDTFSGIGGFSLAGSWMGWRTIQFCEIDKFCQKVLKYHWPDVPLHEDIKTLTSEIIKSSPLYEESESTIFVGGIPCQPWSLAGKRKGEADDRNLWPQSISLIKSFHPDWAVLENVYGFTNWDGGVVFRQVLSDLENEGYEVQPFVIPACSVNAPHRRDRAWIVAHKFGQGLEGADKHWKDTREGKEIRNGLRGHTAECSCQNGDAADTEPTGLERGIGSRESIRLDQRSKQVITDTECQRHPGKEYRVKEPGQHTEKNQGCGWSNFPTQSPLRTGNDGFPGGLDGITISKLRNESIKAAGNAIVPQVALQIFRAINEYELIYTDSK